MSTGTRGRNSCSSIFSLAEVYRRLGRNDEADAILKRIVDKAAADHNIIPEMYVAVPCKLFPGNVGDPTGAMPMVGYGAGAYILDLSATRSVERRAPVLTVQRDRKVYWPTPHSPLK